MSTQKQSSPSKDRQENNIIAALSYVWFLFLIPLLLKRKSSFAQAHAKQGLVLFISEIIGMVLFWIPIFGQLLWLFFIGVSVYGIMKALRGEEWEIPYIGKYSSKFNI